MCAYVSDIRTHILDAQAQHVTGGRLQILTNS